MGTEATVQVLDTSVDSLGVSIVTATKTSAGDRRGSIYNPDTLAAFAPAWFHPMEDGSILIVMTERWHTAAIGTGPPQSYSNAVRTYVPSWVQFNPATGSPGSPSDIPTRIPGTAREVNAACSRREFLYTVGTSDNVAHLQHHRVDGMGGMILQGEELLPDVGPDGIRFCHGCYIDGDHLVVIGLSTTGAVHMARKRWGRIGHNNDPNPEYQWQYRAERGWLNDPGSIAPLTVPSGAPLISQGPVSYAKLRDREYLALEESGDTWRVYSSRRVEQSWSQDSMLEDADYLSFQPSLPINNSMLEEGSRNGIPYVTTVFVPTGGAQQLKVSWHVYTPKKV